MRKTDAQGQPERAVRCAIYTRKSTEEGLNQEFDSLDAQRESAEAYILSQRSEGCRGVRIRLCADPRHRGRRAEATQMRRHRGPYPSSVQTQLTLSRHRFHLHGVIMLLPVARDRQEDMRPTVRAAAFTHPCTLPALTIRWM